MQESDNDRCLPQLTSILKAVQRIFTIRISAKKRSIGEGESAGSPIQVNFKVVPTIIPAKTIVKPHSFPDATGALGDVWRCSMSTLSGTRQVAVKVIRIPAESDQELVAKISQRLRREAYVWIKLKHVNILPFEGITEGFGLLPALVTPWMENGSLAEYLRRDVGLSRDETLNMLKEVAAGLQYLHDNGIVHGDLSPTNILVSSDGRLCLGDFGLSMIINIAESDTSFNSHHVGNVRWMALEILAMPDEGTSPWPTKATDVYSYGCIMIQLLSGHQPYSRLVQAMHVIAARVGGREPFNLHQIVGVPEDVKEFAGRCLSTSSEDRPCTFEILKFWWSRIDITETIMMWMSKLLVNQIPQAVLRKDDDDDLGVLGAALKCMWSRGSNEIKVAVKTLSLDIDNQDDINKAFSTIRREIYIREKLRNENILSLYGMTTGFGVLPSFVHPWMSGGSLHDFVKREPKLSASKKFYILYQVADGIKYLHNEGIVHGNLTGDNVLLDDLGRIRITDFSRSVILLEADDQIFSERIPGDVRYIAPECIVPGSRIGPQKPTKAQDVYSYGCVTILVLSGKVPYWWITEESTVLSERIKDVEPLSPTMEINEVHLNLVRQCLSEEKSRPLIEKVIYSALVQHFGAVDLTNAVERLNSDPQACGAFANVHRCKLQPVKIDEGIRRVVLYDRSTSASTCVEVAVKEIRLSNSTDMLKTINRLFREIHLWLKLQHENVVPLLGVADGFGSLPALVSPWLENGALTGYLQREYEMLSYGRKFALLVDIAHGLQYLHSQDIIHGDLSGNNVLIDRNGKASLVDFGLSALLPGRISQALLPTNPGGTAPWMAPEHFVFDDEGNALPVFSPKNDAYSFGGIMLQVLEGKVPYHYIVRYETIICRISQGVTPKRPSIPVIIDSDWDFIQKCWSKDMERRPSDAEILAFVKLRAGNS